MMGDYSMPSTTASLKTTDESLLVNKVLNLKSNFVNTLLGGLFEQLEDTFAINKIFKNNSLPFFKVSRVNCTCLREKG